MRTPTNRNNKWLPLAFVPLMSIVVLAGCSSDDDSTAGTTGGTTTAGTDGGTTTAGTDGGTTTAGTDGGTTTAGTDGGTTTAGTDGGTTTAGTDGGTTTAGTDGGTTTAGTDGGTTTAGTDGGTTTAGTDGGTTTAGTDGGTTTAGTDGGTTTAGTDGGTTTAGTTGGTTTGGTDGGTTTGGTTGGTGGGSGNLGEMPIGNNNQGTADLNFDGSNLSGTVTLADGITAADVWLYTGIAASRDPGAPAVQLSGSGSSFEIPVNLSADQSNQISSNINAGNLYLLVNTTDGQTLRSLQILPADNVVTATFTELTPQDGTTLLSTGEAFLNFNTESGDFTTALTLNLSASDVDDNGNPINVQLAHIHSGSTAGPVIVNLVSQDNNLWTATGTLSAADLEVILSNDGWFNTHENDGTTPGPSFLSGQITGTP